MNLRRVSTLLRFVFALCLLNFFSYLIVTLYLGGEAGNGHIEDGRYFLNNHGESIETTRQIFERSRMHARSLLITHPVAFVAAILDGFVRRAIAKREKANRDDRHAQG